MVVDVCRAFHYPISFGRYTQVVENQISKVDKIVSNSNKGRRISVTIDVEISLSNGIVYSIAVADSLD